MVPMRTMEESDACMRARLVESLSQSFPGSALSKALMITDDSNSTSDMDNLSNSCFAEIRLDKIKQEPVEEDEDEELKSLTWLQDSDLLKNIGPDDCTLCTSPIDDLQKENNDMNGTGYPGQTHPPHVPYNPQKHVNSKPPYSFSCLIFMSIEDSPIKKLPVKDIYNWILTHFPYFQNAPTGWKNSVRHNLSLNKCFKKVEKEKGHGIGKGSLWCIDPDYRPNLLQALRKTPYHPYHQLQMLSTPQPSVSYDYSVHGVLPINGRPVPFAPRLNINTPSPRLFPFLSKRLGGLDPSASNIGPEDGRVTGAQTGRRGGGGGMQHAAPAVATSSSCTRTRDSEDGVVYMLSWQRGRGDVTVEGSSSAPGAVGRREADIDVANTLVSLKQAAESRRPLKCQRNWSSTGARSRSPSPPEFGSEREKQIIRFGRRALPPKKSVVLTSRPSSDHTYSITKAQLREVMGSPNSSIDEEYEFGSEHQSDIEMSEHEPDDDEDIDEDDMSDDELLTRAQMDVRRKFRLAVAQTSTSRKRLHEDDEDDEALKIAEGADALLNLAGFCANLRPVIKIKDRVASTSSRSVSPNSTAYNNNNNKEVVNGVTIKQEPIDPDDSPSPAQTKPFLGGASIKKEK